MEDEPGPSGSAGGVRVRRSARLAARSGAICDIARLPERWVARTAFPPPQRWPFAVAIRSGVAGHTFPARPFLLTPGLWRLQGRPPSGAWAPNTAAPG